jgi:hypothetical protein
MWSDPSKLWFASQVTWREMAASSEPCFHEIDNETAWTAVWRPMLRVSSAQAGAAFWGYRVTSRVEPRQGAPYCMNQPWLRRATRSGEIVVNHFAEAEREVGHDVGRG